MKIHVVDAFVSGPWSGNPAGVCVLDSWPSDALMQNIAMEMNQAETAFVVRQENSFGLRWFTPTVEVDLCGHATLAASHVLWESGVLSPDQVAQFETKSGSLTCSLQTPWIAMDFPREPVIPADSPAHLFSDRVVWYRNRMDWLVELPSEADVLAFVPDFSVILGIGLRGLIVTARASRADADFVSRFFAPQSGVPEDPVTGSAHCALAPFWAERLGKDRLIGHQVSQRGGVVEVIDRKDRVELRGKARICLVGELHIPA